MAEVISKWATYADIEAAPKNLVAEIIKGKLMTHPRPSLRHGATAMALGGTLIAPFQKATGGPVGGSSLSNRKFVSMGICWFQMSPAGGWSISLGSRITIT